MDRKLTVYQPGMLNAAKNLVRGSLGKKGHKVQEVVATSIRILSDRDLPAFESWVAQYPALRTRLFPPPKIAEYSDLWKPPFVNVTDLYKSISWISLYLARHTNALERYIEILQLYEASVLSGNYEKALSHLDSLQQNLGVSIWLIEARIFVLQRSKGLEAQKEYAQSIHKVAPGSVPSFVAHFTSQRNEESTSLHRFTTRVRTKVDQQPIHESSKIELKHRLTGWQMDEVNAELLSAALSAASAYSVIDAYEALVGVMQAMVESPSLSPFFSVVRRLAGLLPLGDWRLLKLRALVLGDYNGLSFRDLHADESMLLGQYDSAITLATSQARQNPNDMDALAVASWAYSFTERVPEGNGLSPLQLEILTLLTTLRSRRGSVAKAGADLSKLVQNMGSIRVGGAIRGYLAFEWFDEPQVGQSSATRIFSSTAFLNPRHWLMSPTECSESLLRYSLKITDKNIPVSVARAQFHKESLEGRNLPVAIKAVLATEAALYSGDITNALQCLLELSPSAGMMSRRQAAKIEIYCLLLEHNADEATRRIVSYCCDDDDLRYSLPLRPLLSGKQWKDLEHLRADLALPIILDLYWRTVDETEHETNRRFAYDEFLLAHNCRRPSQLAPLEQFARQELVYFWRSVCVPQVMDVSFDVFETSRELLEERIAICSLLAEFDPSRASEYAGELKDISTYLSIQDGIRDVDRSRVHVDLDDVARWAEKQMKESFARYKDLLRAGVGFGSPEDFKKTVRQFEETLKTSIQEYLQYPEQEGDSLLLDIVEAIKTEYLTNSDYGLDAFLSMRIRHGSLAGHLRGVLEEQALIVSKGDGVKYDENAALTTRLQITDQAEMKAVFEAFREFSSTYDGIIEDLTKSRLQILKPEKPEGMFFLSFERNPVGILFIRSHIQEQTTFDDFLDIVFAGIELLLNPRLSEVRDFIKTSVKQSVDAAFEALRYRLETTVPPRSYVKLNSAIADAIPEVQAAIDRVAEWFVPAQRQQAAAIRSIEQIVSIGIEVARHAHRGFSPQIHQDIESVDLQAATLFSQFVDILFTLLDNVYVHSGNRVAPHVSLKIWVEELDATARGVHIRLENEIEPGIYSEAAAQRLDRIRELIDSDEYRQQVNLEGGTGLLKLKRLVSGDDRHNLEFGFIGNDAFFVEIRLVLSAASRTDAESKVGTL